MRLMLVRRSATILRPAQPVLSSTGGKNPAARRSPSGHLLMCALGMAALCRLAAADLPEPAKIEPVKLFECEGFTEGVCFDYDGNGYIADGPRILQFTLDGSHKTWATTGGPDGHKVLADGTHLVCEGAQHAILHLAADATPLAPASTGCEGQPLRSPNDLTLDIPNGGFYFSDPGGSTLEKPIGSVHYVDRAGKTHKADGDMAAPNGLVLTADGKKLYLADSLTNELFVYDVTAPEN